MHPRNNFTKNWLLFTLLLVLPAAACFGQLRADFTIDKPGGCSPLIVSFTNTTTGASANASWQWEFGNGNTSVLKNAGAVYYDEKTYTVKLTVTDGSQTSTQTKSITVYKKPVIDFSFSPAKGCIPAIINFSSNSSAGDGTLTSFNWDFGDGSTQQVSSPVINHTYNFQQTASVSLTASNNYGCSNTITKKDILAILPSLKAAFTADATILCNAPGSVNFSNGSYGPGTLNYEWDFGDGTTSSLVSPSHTYTARGTYTVKLKVTSSEGCTDVFTRTNYINVADFEADFKVPSPVCLNVSTLFTTSFRPTPVSTAWKVDGVAVQTTYGGAPLNFTFTTPGLHTIEMVNNFGPCQLAITKQLDVKKRPEPAGFIVDIAGLCGAPVQVNFKDTTAEAVSWKWNFNYVYWYNDNAPVDANTQAASYTYNSDNWYYTQLTVTNADGCSNSVIKQVAISRPLVGIFPAPGQPTQACGSLSVKFDVRTTEPITNYIWNFGDGTSSTDPSPTHLFNKPGTYDISMSYTTANGCTGKATYNSIAVLKEPVADFTVQSTVCGNTFVHFTSTTTGNFTFLAWDFGDNTGIQYNGAHRYQREGEYNVSLIAINGLCNDTITKPAIIKAMSPFPRINSVENTCDGNRGQVTIIDSTSSASKWTWDFGDGTTQSYTTFQPRIIHNYTKTGQYKVVLTTEGTCTLKDSVDVFVLLKQNPVLSLDNNAICIDSYANFHIRGLESNPFWFSYYGDRYFISKWEYSDGSPFNGTYNLDNINNGTLSYWYTDMNVKLKSNEIKEGNLRLIIKTSRFDCFDTTNYVPITYKGVKAGYEIVSDNNCFKSPVILKDTSKTIGGSSIISWEWNFGDGKVETYQQGGTVSHYYATPGYYNVTLKTTDASGCASTSSYGNYVRVGGPKAAFGISTSSVVQLNTTVTFYNNTNTANTTNVTYLWNFGNGVTSAVFSPSYTYTVPGTYEVVLIAENAQTQCRDTARQTITVLNFNSGFRTNASFIGDYGKCAPVLASFTNTSVNYNRIVWDFGDGFTLENQNYPSHIYNVPGIYIVTLYVYGANGLTGTYRDSIFVNKPAATIQADTLEGCIGQRILLNAPVHTNASSYFWDFGNGYTISSLDSFAIGQYTAAGSYAPGLLIRDVNGCTGSILLQDKVVIHSNPSITITAASQVVCKGLPVQLRASGALDYTWSPVQGLNAGNSDSPLAAPGITTTYLVDGKDIHGCTGSGSITLAVPQPFAMQVTGNADICQGSSTRLEASGAHSYQWINSTAGLNNTQIGNPVASPSASTAYEVVGFDQYKCYSDTGQVNVTIRPLPTVNAGPDRQVAYGSENILTVTNSSDVVRWNWTPADFLSCNNCPAPVSKPMQPIEYVVTVYTAQNCMAKDTINLKVACVDGNVFIPTAFTPNNDGKNELFGVSGSGVGIIRSFRIYNRWGEIIFERKNVYPGDANASWNGKHKGLPADAGAYVYFIEMECGAGEKIERKGTVTLIR